MKTKRSSGSWLFIIFIVFAVLSFGYFIMSDEPFLLPDLNGTVGEKEINCTHHGLPEDGWIYEQLNDTERMIYDTFVTELSAGSLSHTFTDVDTNTFDKALDNAISAILYEHPEFFWVNGGYTYTKSIAFGSVIGDVEVVLMCYDYWTYTSDPQKYIDTLEAKVDEIAEMARAYESDYERILFVHDYIVSNVDYNDEAASETNSTIRKASSEQAYSAYGCLVDNQAVCGGYSKAFQMLMTELGIECIYVKGYAGGYHGWNCVRIGDDYYFMDLTWDDPSLTNEDGSLRFPSGVTYTYFGLTSEQMGRTHTPLDDFAVPDCTATEFNYYRQMGLCLDEYSFQAFKAVAEMQKDRQIISIAFSSEEAFREAEAEIIGDKKYSNIEVIRTGKVISYYLDEDNYVMNFYKD